MVHFKRVVLSLVFTLGSLISADVTIPSLKEIILAIPDDVVRGSIESAYMAGDFDEVERGLINFLEDYDYEDSGVENVDEVKEKAMGIVYERVKETRAAAFNDLASQAVEDPDSSEVEDMDEPTAFEEAKSFLKSMSVPDLVAKMEEGEAKTKALEDIESKDRTMTISDLVSYLELAVHREFPDMPEEHVDILKNMLHAKVDDYFGTEGFQEGEDPFASKSFKEIVESIPDDEEYGEYRAKLLKDIEDGDLNKAELDVDELVDSLTDLDEEKRESVKALLHVKIMEFGNDEEGFQEGADEDEDPFASMSFKEIVESIPDDEKYGEYKAKLLKDIEDGDLNKAELDVDELLDSLDLDEEKRESVKALLHEKIMEHGNDEEGFQEGADEDEGPSGDKDLESMNFKEIVESIPDEEYGEFKAKILKDIEDGDLNKAEIDVDELVDSLGMEEEERESVKALLHEKIMAYVPTEAASELMEGESSIVDALRAIAETQQKITDLLNELEGGI
jgi:hypothetical protein